MERIRDLLSALPPWLFSITTLAAILWLTLAPKPLGENPPELFPGADKAVHAIMFGGLTVTILFDLSRKKHWKRVAGLAVAAAALFSSATGTAIEFLQESMEMGRSFELTDIAADSIGAATAALIWWIFLK